MESLNLKDVVAVRNEQNSHSLNFKGIIASRLDRFYDSDDVMNNILETATKPTSLSDQQSLILRMRIDQQQLAIPYGYGYWKINPSLLMQENVMSTFEEKLRQIKLYALYGRNIVEWWLGNFKTSAKSFFKKD
jgi:hypothetical protein